MMKISASSPHGMNAPVRVGWRGWYKTAETVWKI